MKWNPRSTRILQLAFFGLFVTCVAQATFWVVEQVLYTSRTHQLVLDGYAGNAQAARLMLESGSTPSRIRELYPNLDLDESGTLFVRPEIVTRLNDERASRINRYVWEGLFFLVVLLSGIAVIRQVLKQRADLLHRQQNFLAAVTHEFKSPLASLRLSAETLTVRRPDEMTLERISSRLVSDVGRLEAMVTNILDAARIDSGATLGEPERVDLSAEVRRIIEQEHIHASRQGVQMECDLPESAFVSSDRVALRTVLRNLVHNATKSVAASGGGTIRLQAVPDGRHVRIDVIDDGLGFDPAEASMLFEEFYRPGDEMRRKTKGTGLGLHIVRSFVKEAGGKVKASSQGPGHGATFSVWWPEAAPEESTS